MKKVLFICFICLMSCAFSQDKLEFVERSQEFYTNLSDEGVKFYTKMQTCSPYKLKETKEAIYGKTKNGKCHYAYDDIYKGQYVQNNCIIPMQTAIGFATTALDVIDYSKQGSPIADERMQQNNEIRKIVNDYCKLKVK